MPGKGFSVGLGTTRNVRTMEFRRITNLPPYVFTIIDGLKVEARREGKDVIDLGFGNPDLPSPAVAVEKLSEAARNSRNHRYSSSRGIPKLREAVADLYLRRFGVALDPDREIISTIGAKEGFSHLMWVLLQPGDAALVPSPSYPIHIWGPHLAGADVREIPISTDTDFFVTAAAAEGDAQALAVLEKFGWWVALGVANLVNILDSEIVVIGGGLAEAGDLLLDPIRAAYGELMMGINHREPVPIVQAQLGERAGAWGAALLAAART